MQTCNDKIEIIKSGNNYAVRAQCFDSYLYTYKIRTAKTYEEAISKGNELMRIVHTRSENCLNCFHCFNAIIHELHT